MTRTIRARPVDREQALTFRQDAAHLRRRLRRGSLVQAARSGLQDSAPRSAVLSLYARVHGVSASSWEDPELAQIWGPRGAVYVVPKEDLAVFTLGRLPRDHVRRNAVEEAARRVRREMGRSGRAKARTAHEHLQHGTRDLRSASATGTIRIRWDGSAISWWLVEPPTADVEESRLELARRFLESTGPATPRGFAWWSGGTLSDAKDTFRLLGEELYPVSLEGKQAWILKDQSDSLGIRAPPATVRLLPQGDPYLGTPDRALLVPDPRFRAELWPRSVWPGALFAEGELVGTWRRREGHVVVRPWRRLSSETVEATELEADGIPIDSQKDVRWEEPVRG